MEKRQRTLGEKLRELREYYCVSQAQVAQSLNIDRSTYSNYELDRTQPNLENLVRLARLFGVPKGSLLPDDEEEETSFKELLKHSGMLSSLNKEERGLVLRFRGMSRAHKDKIHERMDELANNPD